ncbi:2-isopropylmalate synthase [Streptomyces cylindrosporus]|uniref:2-isopropylmalate synthase n=1 Tax=Streptomyces cylindrosporus TaxID=2927583 RepID=A0ABS9Y7N9_9ACTN|nr:2-isopropylmalate synthase [Streptomyces cylindrosporus]MCI3273238.1 2-isopropylmalate synthase [Streptomyces cylindrosporus]
MSTTTAAWNPQGPSPMPYHRYRPYQDRVNVPADDRSWPAARIDRAPLWVPVDLRDGNQALAEPMDTPRKRRFFDLLTGVGFKEIEVGYPSASRTDFDFVRHLVTSGAVPDDVTPVVFTPARPELIDRTFESIAGLERAVVHLYIATSPVWREVVLGRDRHRIRETVREAAERMARLAGDSPGIRFQFSPETFNLTEPDFVLELCDGLTELWDASPDRPVTHNLPATVEIATPNVYADQIEYMHRRLSRRDSVILSVHPHNDRGTGVACAELAVLAGAQRVEGCLFGNGERTGNVDLVTLALNLYSQGVDPMVDFSDIDAVRETVEHCNRLPVHPRHPYAGDLVHTAFSGTHQDAIDKGFAHRAEHPDEPWQVPYLPIDPADIGRSYEAVIRVNSQSGKGGVAYLLRTHHGIDLPPRMRPDFSRVVQEATDESGREATPKELYGLFVETYLVETCLTEERPVDPGEFEILELVEDGTAAFAEVRVDGVTAWGAGLGPSASAQAVRSAAHRAAAR